MSRIGNMPIAVPAEAEVTINRSEVNVKGPKGELSRTFSPDMIITFEGDKLTVSRPSDGRIHRSLHGLTRSLLASMVEGVTRGFERTLELQGVGYRAAMSDDKLVLRIGYSHPVEVVPPPGVSISVEVPNRIKVSGIDKQAVGEVAAKIRAIRPPDSYLGKGIRYAGERVRRKAGKAGRVGKSS